MATSKIVWKKHPDGGFYASYRLGTITKFKSGKTTYYNVKLGYNDIRMASNLVDAKKKIDLYTNSKTKMATKAKTATKSKPAAKKKVVKAKTQTVKSELKALGLRLPHGYEVVKRSPKKKKAVAKKKATPKKRVVKKVSAKKATPKKKATKKRTAKSWQRKMF